MHKIEKMTVLKDFIAPREGRPAPPRTKARRYAVAAAEHDVYILRRNAQEVENDAEAADDAALLGPCWGPGRAYDHPNLESAMDVKITRTETNDHEGLSCSSGCGQNVETPGPCDECSMRDARPTVTSLKLQVEAKRLALDPACSPVRRWQLPTGLRLVEPSATAFDRASSFTSHVPDLRAEQRRLEYLADVRRLSTMCGEHLTQGDLNRVCAAWEAWLSATGRCASSMITGPSNFPVRRAQKASDSADRRLDELVKLCKRIVKRCAKDAKATEVDAAGGPLAVLRQEIVDLEHWREMAKAANRVVRTKPKNERTDTKVVKLLALDVTRPQAEALFVADWCGRYGFADYELTNSLAKLKSKRERLVELERRNAAACKPDEEVVHGDVTVTVSYEDDRISIRHTEIPPKSVREALKASGWRFSRRNGNAWQRQLTDAARASVEELLGIGHSPGVPK